MVWSGDSAGHSKAARKSRKLHPDSWSDRNEGIVVTKKRVIIANIVWNKFGWRNNTYVNPHAGFRYARTYPGHESLNFDFNKKGIDDEENVYGFIQFSAGFPSNLDKHSLIIKLAQKTPLSESGDE